MITAAEQMLECIPLALAVVMFGMGIGLLACVPFVSRW